MSALQADTKRGGMCVMVENILLRHRRDMDAGLARTKICGKVSSTSMSCLMKEGVEAAIVEW